MHADKIFVLERGNIIESAVYDLLAEKGIVLRDVAPADWWRKMRWGESLTKPAFFTGLSV